MGNWQLYVFLTSMPGRSVLITWLYHCYTFCRTSNKKKQHLLSDAAGHCIAFGVFFKIRCRIPLFQSCAALIISVKEIWSDSRNDEIALVSYGMDNVYSDDQGEQKYRCPFDDGIIRDASLYRNDPCPLKQNNHLFYTGKIQCVDTEYEQPSFHDTLSLLIRLILLPFL